MNPQIGDSHYCDHSMWKDNDVAENGEADSGKADGYIYTYISVSVRVYLGTVVLFFVFACFAFFLFFFLSFFLSFFLIIYLVI